MKGGRCKSGSSSSSSSALREFFLKDERIRRLSNVPRSVASIIINGGIKSEDLKDANVMSEFIEYTMTGKENLAELRELCKEILKEVLDIIFKE